MQESKLENQPSTETLEAASSTGPAPQNKTRDGIVLIPQPSDEPRDPLNWSQRKKYFTLFIVSLSAFVGTASSLANQLSFGAQSKVYDKTLVQMSYSVRIPSQYPYHGESFDRSMCRYLLLLPA